MLGCLQMIQVTTAVYKDRGLDGDETPEDASSWRVHSCTIDFGTEDPPLTFSSTWVYASPDAAHADMRTQALVKIRERGHTEPENAIRWRLHMIG